MGTPSSPGTVVATVVGDVARPVVVEVEMGTRLSDLLTGPAGGPLPGRTWKAVFSGVANPVLDPSRVDPPMTYEDFTGHGSGLGAGAAGFIVYDDTACMVNVARVFSQFLAVESCGQCPPCKLGSGEITERLERIEAGTGRDDDITLIGSWLGQVTDGARCYLATEEREVVSSILRSYPEEFAEHLETGPQAPRLDVRPRLSPAPVLATGRRAGRRSPRGCGRRSPRTPGCTSGSAGTCRRSAAAGDREASRPGAGGPRR